jgi:hypothetical protein
MSEFFFMTLNITFSYTENVYKIYQGFDESLCSLDKIKKIKNKFIIILS